MDSLRSKFCWRDARNSSYASATFSFSMEYAICCTFTSPSITSVERVRASSPFFPPRSSNASTALDVWRWFMDWIWLRTPSSSTSYLTVRSSSHLACSPFSNSPLSSTFMSTEIFSCCSCDFSREMEKSARRVASVMISFIRLANRSSSFSISGESFSRICCICFFIFFIVLAVRSCRIAVLLNSVSCSCERADTCCWIVSTVVLVALHISSAHVSCCMSERYPRCSALSFRAISFSIEAVARVAVISSSVSSPSSWDLSSCSRCMCRARATIAPT
mmetsp:Transcript_25692/g.68701  ORF Transcript_25692/g.68701 Transcript_25692/m.68701 type:complete len:276 (+) Transcript_25692:948-1775(+)